MSQQIQVLHGAGLTPWLLSTLAGAAGAAALLALSVSPKRRGRAFYRARRLAWRTLVFCYLTTCVLALATLFAGAYLFGRAVISVRLAGPASRALGRLDHVLADADSLKLPELGAVLFVSLVVGIDVMTRRLFLRTLLALALLPARLASFIWRAVVGEPTTDDKPRAHDRTTATIPIASNTTACQTPPAASSPAPAVRPAPHGTPKPQTPCKQLVPSPTPYMLPAGCVTIAYQPGIPMYPNSTAPSGVKEHRADRELCAVLGTALAGSLSDLAPFEQHVERRGDGSIVWKTSVLALYNRISKDGKEMAPVRDAVAGFRQTTGEPLTKYHLAAALINAMRIREALAAAAWEAAAAGKVAMPGA